MPESLWKRYARIWSSEPGIRATELEACLADTCSYCDVNGLIEGRESLSIYMDGFQQNVPGGKFEILSVIHHHGRMLADWSLLGPRGAVLQTGRSFATIAADGRLQNITGFFDPAGEVRGS